MFSDLCQPYPSLLVDFEATAQCEIFSHQWKPTRASGLRLCVPSSSMCARLLRGLDAMRPTPSYPDHGFHQQSPDRVSVDRSPELPPQGSPDGFRWLSLAGTVSTGRALLSLDPKLNFNLLRAYSLFHCRFIPFRFGF